MDGFQAGGVWHCRWPTQTRWKFRSAQPIAGQERLDFILLGKSPSAVRA